MRNLIALFTVILLFSNTMNAQTLASVNESSLSPLSYDKVETTLSTSREFAVKTWKNLEKQIVEKLQEELVYPKLATEHSTEGTVIVQFTFDGEVTNPRVIQSIGSGCDKAALQAVKQISQYYQQLGGSKIRPISIKLPFRFRI